MSRRPWMRPASFHSVGPWRMKRSSITLRRHASARAPAPCLSPPPPGRRAAPPLRGAAPRERLDQVANPLRRPLEAVLAGDAGAGRVTHAPAPRRRPQQGTNRVRECPGVPLGDEHPGLFVAHEVRHPSSAGRHHREAVPLGFEHRHPHRLADPRPDEEVRAGVEPGERLAFGPAGEGGPSGRQPARERRLHLAPRRSLAGHHEMPARGGETGAREGVGEHLEGGELASAPHHRDAEQPRLVIRNPEAARDRRPRAGPARCGVRPGGDRWREPPGTRPGDSSPSTRTGSRSSRLSSASDPPRTEEGGKHDDPRPVPCDLPHARHIVAIEREDCVRVPNGLRRRIVSDAPPPPALFRRVRGLRHQVGDAEALADERPDPVGGLVVEVIGEPEVGAPAGGSFPVAVKQPVRDAGADLAEPRLPIRIARPVEAAEARCDVDLPAPRRAGPFERREEEPRDRAVARRHRVVGSLERGVERDPHAARLLGPSALLRKGSSASISLFTKSNVEQ